MNIVKAEYQVEEIQGFKVYKAQDVYDVLKEHFNPLQEEFYLLPVVAQEFCIERLFVGGLTASSTDLKTLFHLLLTKYPNAPAFIIAHNHPSGLCDPSGADKEVTKQIKEASELLGYSMLDHLIFSNRGYYSFHNEGEIITESCFLPLDHKKDRG